MKVKISAFERAVDAIAKNLKNTNQDRVSEINLPDELKPFAEDLTSYTSYVDENGHIIGVDGDKSGQVSNFVARIMEIREFDNDVEVENQFIIDRWYYLYSGGAIGGDEILVADMDEVKGYYFKEYDYKIEDCAEYVNKFLNIAPHDVTIPLLAHAFLSILIEKLKLEEIEPRYLLWIYGASGTFKTALSVVLLNFFGTF
jgi:hypothetical protein